MPRSPYAYNINRGGCSVRKVKRWLRALGPVVNSFETEETKARHVHPRRKRLIAPKADEIEEKLDAPAS